MAMFRNAVRSFLPIPSSIASLTKYGPETAAAVTMIMKKSEMSICLV
jgi:hypothetical protein